jgi:hypothetical protein
MFTWPKTEKTGLEKVIDALELYLQEVGPDDENYTKLTKELGALYTMKKGDSRPRVSPDVLIQAGAGIATVLLILHYEKLGVITSKALSFVRIR